MFGLDYTASDLPKFFNKFMRRPDSHAHRQHRNGSIFPNRLQYLHSSGFAKASLSLREVSMGYVMGDTAAPGLTEFRRCALLGNAIDQKDAERPAHTAMAGELEKAAPRAAPGCRGAVRRQGCTRQHPTGQRSGCSK